MNEQTIPLAIVGGGPAGLAAAAEAASLGIGTILLENSQQLGGQYFKLPAAEFQAARATPVEAEGRRLAEAAQRAGAILWTDTVVWGVYAGDPFILDYTRGEAARLRPRQIIFAAGGYDRPVPFPGWTLPGVMTAGGVLAALKSQRLSPGQRFVLAGSGPLQLSLAAHLIAAGAQVEGLLELRRLTDLAGAWRNLGTIMQQKARLSEGMTYANILRKAGVPLRFGRVIVRAEGDDKVERIVAARADAQSRPLPASEETITADTLCLGYGFLPSNQLPRLLGCEHLVDEKLGVHLPIRDAWLQTSVPGAFVAGDAGGTGGKEAALLEGRLAALGAAERAGVLTGTQAQERARPLLAALANERRFAAFLDERFGPLPGLRELATDDTVLCRCENVTVGQVKRAVAQGAQTFADIKAHTRAGMGRCGGRICNSLIAQLLAEQTGRPLEWASRYSVRPPIFPVSLEELEALGNASTTPGLHFD